MILRTLFRGASVALLFASMPIAVAPVAAQSANMPAAAASFGSAIYPTQGRYLLVDAASARLFMVEDGQIRDTMKVIVGKPTSQTPTIASKIYYATLNPYWNVPADLAQKLIAPRVLAQGTKYLTSRHYQVLASFDDGAPEIAPESVNWKAVAEGRATVKVRQLPGPANSMGQVKFGFPNANGVFLHDSPEKELFESDQRQLSNGCVRLEDAPRLARWLMGRDPSEFGSQPEEHVLLPKAVPIYITYLNAPVNTASADAPVTFASASR